MMQLIGQMVFCLLLAFLLGLFLGWLLWARSCKKRMEELEGRYRDQLSECERSLRTARREISDLENQPAVEAAPVVTDSEPAVSGPADSKSPAAKASIPESSTAAPATAVGLVSAAGAGAETLRDDLKKVEGIGPKIQGLLNDDGIFTWAQLAATSVEVLKGILERAGDRYRMHDPATWPDQAKLLAEGRLDELKKFQDFLKGGRAV